MRIEIEQDGVIVDAELRDGTFSLGGGTRDHLRVSSLPAGMLRLSVVEDRLIVAPSKWVVIGGAPVSARVARLVLPGEWIELSRIVRVRRSAEAAKEAPATQAVMRELLGEDAASVVPPPAGAPELIGLTGLELGRTFPIVDGPNRIGRGLEVPVRIRDRSVSREHAELTWTADGAVLTDLGTANGTFVNGKRIRQATRLRPGDVIEVGRTLLKAVLPQLPERPPPPPGSPEALAQQQTTVRPSASEQRRTRRAEWTLAGVGLATALVGLALSCGLAR